MKAKTLILSLLSLFVFSAFTYAQNTTPVIDTSLKYDENDGYFCELDEGVYSHIMEFAKQGDAGLPKLKECCANMAARPKMPKKCSNYNAVGSYKLTHVAAALGAKETFKYLVTELGMPNNSFPPALSGTGFTQVMTTSIQGYEDFTKAIVKDIKPGLSSSALAVISPKYGRDAAGFAYDKYSETKKTVYQNIYSFLSGITAYLPEGAKASAMHEAFITAITYDAENLINQMKSSSFFQDLNTVLEQGNKI